MSNPQFNKTGIDWDITASRVYSDSNKNLTLDASGNSSLILKTNGTSRLSIDSSGFSTFSKNITVNGLSVGTGSGQISSNTSLGAGVLNSNTSGNNNVGVGYVSLTSNINGNYNVGVGNYSLVLNTNGDYNVGIGNSPLYSNTNGDYNIGIGNSPLYSNTTGTFNLGIGNSSLYSNTIGANNIAVGTSSSYSQTTNTQIASLNFPNVINQYAAYDTGFEREIEVYFDYIGSPGNGASGYIQFIVSTQDSPGAIVPAYILYVGLNSRGTGYASSSYASCSPSQAYNAGIFDYTSAFTQIPTLLSQPIVSTVNVLTPGSYNNNNLAIGNYSLFTNNGSNNNTAIGYRSLYNFNGVFKVNFSTPPRTAIVLDGNNTAVGYESGYSCTSAANSTVMGYQSGYKLTDGSGNSFLGYQAGYNCTSGYYNIAIGYQSLWGVSTTFSGDNSIAIGTNTLRSATTSNANIAIGTNSLYNSTSGGYNIAIGIDSGRFCTGSTNTLIGWAAGNGSVSLTTGTNNTCLGSQASTLASTTSNSITLGNSSITSLRCQITSISGLSDQRDKTDIQDLTIGLDFINKVRPVKFKWNMRPEKRMVPSLDASGNEIQDASGNVIFVEEEYVSSRNGDIEAGFIAQELDAVQTETGTEWLDIVLKDNPERLEATQGKLLPIIVKAIQELSQQNKILMQEIALLKNK